MPIALLCFQGILQVADSRAPISKSPNASELQNVLLVEKGWMSSNELDMYCLGHLSDQSTRKANSMPFHSIAKRQAITRGPSMRLGQAATWENSTTVPGKSVMNWNNCITTKFLWVFLMEPLHLLNWSAFAGILLSGGLDKIWIEFQHPDSSLEKVFHRLSTFCLLLCHTVSKVPITCQPQQFGQTTWQKLLELKSLNGCPSVGKA